MGNRLKFNTMTKTKKASYIVVRPKGGYWLTNGEYFSEEMYVPLTFDCTQLREVTAEEKEAMEAEIEASMQAEIQAEMTKNEREDVGEEA